MVLFIILLTRDKPRLLGHFYQEGFFIEPCEPPGRSAFFIGVVMDICKIDECNENVYVKGYCSKHYRSYNRHGNPLYIYKPEKRICKVDGCNNPHKGLGYCKKHYTRFKRYGDPLYSFFGKDRESHGMENTSIYHTWQNIRTRCYNPKSQDFPDYGGRGITVCDRWLNSFIDFYKDMGDKPFKNAQIDREDNDGNYEPDNCRWVTPKVNANNRRISIKRKEL